MIIVYKSSSNLSYFPTYPHMYNETILAAVSNHSFCQTLFHINLSAVFDITDLFLTLVYVSFCDTFLDHLFLLTSDLSVHSSKERPQCGGTTNCVLDYCLLFHSLQVILSSDANWFYSSSGMTNHTSTLAKPVFSRTIQNTVSSLIHSWIYLVFSSDSMRLR